VLHLLHYKTRLPEGTSALSFIALVALARLDSSLSRTLDTPNAGIGSRIGALSQRHCPLAGEMLDYLPRIAQQERECTLDQAWRRTVPVAVQQQ
jgi:hypothetical protein